MSELNLTDAERKEVDMMGGFWYFNYMGSHSKDPGWKECRGKAAYWSGERWIPLEELDDYLSGSVWNLPTDRTWIDRLCHELENG